MRITHTIREPMVINPVRNLVMEWQGGNVILGIKINDEPATMMSVRLEDLLHALQVMEYAAGWEGL